MDVIFIALSFSAFTIALIFIREVFLWLRNKIPKTVQCWFCHIKTKVEYRISNSWYCQNCDQYNGFTKDGDYNRTVDNLYEEKLNFSVSTIGRSKDAWKSTNRLCEKCNHNQELKVQQLASFVPLNEKNYDVEIEHYRAQLEKCYKLCSNCDGLLSKIFGNERNIFSIPRRLVTSLKIKPRVTGFARFVLYMNLLVSLIISISAYTDLEGIPPIVSKYLQEYDHFNVPLKVFKPSYLLIVGLVLNIVGWMYTFSSGLLLNSISWFIVLLLTAYPSGYKHYIISLQAISGIISCGVSIITLASNRRKFKKNVKNNLSEGKKFNSSQPFVTNLSSFVSSPAYTPPYEEHTPQLSQKIYGINTNYYSKSPPPSPSSSPKRPTSASNIIKPQKNWAESINSGIRGLNLGGQNGNGLRNLTTQRRIGDPLNPGGDAWWMRQKRSTQKNINSGLRPPSTSSSGFSDMVEDIVDDCASCTGHSPICRHSCHFTPSPQQFTCYYAAAYFQRLLYTTPPSPKMTTNTQSQLSIHDPFLYIYTMPIIALIASNIALLWTVYNQEVVKE